jgi:YgiT-type zinc finger domain-containing protein
MKINHSDKVFPCNECQAGQMHQTYLTYFTWLDDELITVPDFPAWVCDVCGKREFDLHALNQLSLLLSPNAGKPTSRKRTPSQKMKQKGPIASRTS